MGSRTVWRCALLEGSVNEEKVGLADANGAMRFWWYVPYVVTRPTGISRQISYTRAVSCAIPLSGSSCPSSDMVEDDVHRQVGGKRQKYEVEVGQASQSRGLGGKHRQPHREQRQDGEHHGPRP